MDPNKLNTEEGMKLLYEMLDTLIRLDTKQGALMAYGNFEKYTTPETLMSISSPAIK